MAPEGRKVGSLKRRGAEPSGQMRDEKLHAVVARSTFASENAKNTSSLEHFWKLRCRKMHVVVARNTSRSQNVQSTPFSGPLLEVMSKKCTLLNTFRRSDVLSRGRRKGLCTSQK